MQNHIMRFLGIASTTLTVALLILAGVLKSFAKSRSQKKSADALVVQATGLVVAFLTTFFYFMGGKNQTWENRKLKIYVPVATTVVSLIANTSIISQCYFEDGILSSLQQEMYYAIVSIAVLILVFQILLGLYGHEIAVQMQQDREQKPSVGLLFGFGFCKKNPLLQKKVPNNAEEAEPLTSAEASAKTEAIRMRTRDIEL